MPGEQDTVDDLEPEAPVEDLQPDAELPETQETDIDPEAEQPQDDDEEFEWDGKVIKGPKGLKDGLMLKADHTRKTMEIAATRRELEQREQSLAQRAQADEADLHVRASLVAIDAEIAKLSNIDWDTWRRTDFYAAEAGKDRLAALKEGRQQAANYLHQRQDERQVVTQQETAKRLHETRTFAEKNIKGWTPEVDAEVTSFVLSKGIAPELFLGSVNPAIYELAHLAMIGAKTLSKPTVTKAPTPVPALKTVTGKSTAPAVKPVKEWSLEDHAKQFEKEMAAGRR